MTEQLVTYSTVDESPLKLVPCSDRTHMRATGPIRHLCPYADEVDEGTVTISWITDGSTFELHSLRELLATFAESKLSHEAVASLLRGDLDGLKGIESVDVSLEFATAGFDCTVTALDPD